MLSKSLISFLGYPKNVVLDLDFIPDFGSVWNELTFFLLEEDFLNYLFLDLHLIDNIFGYFFFLKVLNHSLVFKAVLLIIVFIFFFFFVFFFFIVFFKVYRKIFRPVDLSNNLDVFIGWDRFYNQYFDKYNITDFQNLFTYYNIEENEEEDFFILNSFNERFESLFLNMFVKGVNLGLTKNTLFLYKWY